MLRLKEIVHMRATIQTKPLINRGAFARFVTLVVLWIIPVTSSAQDEIVARGRLEYQGYCAICHGENGKGNGIMARYLLIKPADLTQLSKNNRGEFPFWRTYWTIDGREEVKGHGSRVMPIWGDRFRSEQGAEGPAAWIDLARGRIWQLVVFLQSIQEF
jgi:mono/diheme cytochrome c family protein